MTRTHPAANETEHEPSARTGTAPDIPADADTEAAQTPPATPERRIMKVRRADGSEADPVVVPAPGRHRAWITAVAAVVVALVIAALILLG